jgi:hypothetical protein
MFSSIQSFEQARPGDHAHVTVLLVDHRQAAGSVGDCAEQIADRGIRTQDRNIFEECRADTWLRLAQLLLQGIHRDQAVVALPSVDHIAEFAVVLAQAREPGTDAVVVALDHRHLGLTGDVAGLEHGGHVHPAKKCAHVVIGGVFQDVVRCAHLHHAPTLHDGNAIADAHGLVEVVGDEDDGAAAGFLQFQQFILHFAADQWIQRGECFVHQHHRGIIGQRSCQSNALLHAARKFIGVAVSPGIETHLFEGGQRPSLTLCRGDAGQFETKGGVLAHAQVRHQSEGLEHHAHIAAAQFEQFGIADGGDVAAIDNDLAGARLDQPVEQAHEGGLAGARQPHDDENLALADGKIGITDPDSLSGTVEDVVLIDALAEQAQGVLRLIAEDLVQVFDDDFVLHFRSSASAGNAEALRLVELGYGLAPALSNPGSNWHAQRAGRGRHAWEIWRAGLRSNSQSSG